MESQCSSIEKKQIPLNGRLNAVVMIPKNMLTILKKPKAICYRRYTMESWQERWHRKFGVLPKLKTKGVGKGRRKKSQPFPSGEFRGT